MKLIVAVIQPTKLDSVRTALAEMAVERLTVFDAEGYGRQRGQTATFRGIEYKTNLLRKVIVEIAVNDDFLEKTLSIIENVSRTGQEGNIGDGKILVLPIEQVVQIGGKEKGPSAV